jgi:periplasmic protein TonB
MMHTYQPATHVALTYENEDHSLLWALIVSMLLHIAIAYVFPYFNQQRLQPRSTSIQVELNPLPEQPTPAQQQTQPPTEQISQPEVQPEVQPEPPKPIPPTPVTKPLKAKTERPLLAAATQEPDPSYQVPVEQTTETPPVTQTETPQVPSQKPQPTQPAHTQTNTTSAPTQTNTAPANTEPATSSTAQQATARSSEVATSDEVWDGYGKALAAMVNKLKQYPTIAIRRHLEGEVQVIASFKQGKLISVELAEGSQHQVLNEEAMRTIKKAIEQVALHANLERKTFTVTVPVGFKLE